MEGEHGVEVWQTTGDAGRHECCAQIENENKWVVTEATAMSLEGTANEDQIMAVAGEAIVAGRQVSNHTIRGEMQKKEGKTGWELHAGQPVGSSGVLIKPENVASWKCVLDPKRLVCPPRYALCGKRLNPATMVLAIMSLINADFVDSVDLFRHLIPRSGVKFPCRK